MTSPLIIALQGRMQSPDVFREQSRLDEIAAAINADVTLLCEHRTDWPSAADVNGHRYVHWLNAFEMRAIKKQAATLPMDNRPVLIPTRPIILLGHSDGATMALRLAITCRKIVAAVVSYAAVYDHWRHHEETPGETWPPALMLNNQRDDLVDSPNAINIFAEWSNPLAKLCEHIPGPTLPECHHFGDGAALATHYWQPEAANLIIVEWLRGILERKVEA